ncbi:MAG: sporulation protein YtfJ [Clostridia bacterium]|nr:sporulation protein YtfJ [Clostridia bacterium]
MEEKQNKIKNVVDIALKNLSEIIDVNIIIGQPINVDKDIIIPISKVTFGVLSGGGEYGKLGIFNKNDNLPFSVGNGSIVSIKPCGFLVKDEIGAYKIVSVSENSYEKLIENATDLIKNLKVKNENN